MFPGGTNNGWETLGITHNEQPVSRPLPVPLETIYEDGAATYSITHNAIDFPVLRTVLGGSIQVEATAGGQGGSFGFKVHLRQMEAYGVMLLDTLQPPYVAPGFCTDTIVMIPEVDFDVLHDQEESCAVELYVFWLFDGDTIFNGDRAFGAF